MERIEELFKEMNELMNKGFNPYPIEEWNKLYYKTFPEYKKDFTEEQSIMYSTIIARSVAGIENKETIRKMIEFFLDENWDDSVSFNQRQKIASLAHAMLLRQDYEYHYKLYLKYKTQIDALGNKKIPPSCAECIRELKYCWTKTI